MSQPAGASLPAADDDGDTERQQKVLALFDLSLPASTSAQVGLWRVGCMQPGWSCQHVDPNDTKGEIFQREANKEMQRRTNREGHSSLMHAHVPSRGAGARCILVAWELRA